MITTESMLWPFWRDVALGGAGVIFLAWGLDRWVKSTVWRQSVWQACILGLALMVSLEFTGLRFGLSMVAAKIWPAWQSPLTLIPPKQGMPLIASSAQLAPADSGDTTEITRVAYPEATPPHSVLTAITPNVAPPLPLNATPDAPSPEEQLPQASQEVSLDVWLLLLWMSGAALVGLRIAGSFLWTIWLTRHAHPERSPAIRQMVEQLAPLLGMAPPRRILSSYKLASPLNCGLIQPGIILPIDFEKRFHPDQQRAMLAHEMAHIAGRDLAWMMLSECLLLLLWWHPLIWFAQGQLRRRTEAVADEASSLLPGGPTALAECLVHFGSRMAAGPALRWAGLGAHGFRSGLGQRVEQLLKLASEPRSVALQKGPRRARLAIALLMLSGFVMCEALPFRTQPIKGDTMSVIQLSWKKSAAAALVAMAVETSQPILLQAAVPGPTPPDQQHPPAAVEKAAEAPANALPLSRNEILEALRSVVIENLVLTNAPLPDVLKALNREVREKSPRHQPINFIISRNPPGSAETQAAQWPDDPKRAIIDQLSLCQVSLRDLLDVLVLSADQPLAWRIEDYGIVLSPPGPEQSEANAPYRGMSPELLKRYGIIPPSSPASSSGLASNEPQREAARNRIRRLLANTFTDTIEADEAALANFLRLLGEHMSQKNPNEPPLNFVLSKKTASSEIIPESVLNNATITIKPALHRVRFQDLLTMIPAMSSIPLNFTIEPYGVLFTPNVPKAALAKPAPPEKPSSPGRDLRPMTAKAFKVSPRFLQGLQQTFDLNLPDLTMDTDAEKKIKSAISSLTERLGIRPFDTEKQVFFNQTSFAVMIKATDRDLAVLEAAILTVGGMSLGTKTNSDLLDIAK